MTKIFKLDNEILASFQILISKTSSINILTSEQHFKSHKMPLNINYTIHACAHTQAQRRGESLVSTHSKSRLIKIQNYFITNLKYCVEEI